MGFTSLDEETDAIGGALQLIHLTEFFYNEARKHYSDSVRFLKDSDFSQPDCLVLDRESDITLGSREYKSRWIHTMTFRFPVTQSLGRSWTNKDLTVATLIDSEQSVSDNNSLDDSDTSLLETFIVDEIDLATGLISIRIPAKYILPESDNDDWEPALMDSIQLSDLSFSPHEIESLMVWDHRPKYDQASAMLEVVKNYANGKASNAALQIIEKQLPSTTNGRTSFWAPPEELFEHALESTLSLDNSYLPVQGPPGTGKTYLGSYLVRGLLEKGKRVAITSQSWAGVNNLLKGCLDWFITHGQEAALNRIIIRSNNPKGLPQEYRQFINAKPKESRPREFGPLDPKDPESTPEWFKKQKAKPFGMIRIEDEPPVLGLDLYSEAQLVAGTSFQLAHSGLRQACQASDTRDDYQFDYLFIDEAGQFSLAETLSLSIIAKNIILLGDPKQLPQVTKADHPHGAGLSVLEHLLGKEKNAEPNQGYFLDATYRMRPEINRFISEEFYESKLICHPSVNSREVIGIPNGIYFYEAEHSGCQKESEIEAKVVVEIIEELIGKEYVDGSQHRLIEVSDFMVVAPYGDHVKAIREQLRQSSSDISSVRVETVDKFQGQQAPIVVYSMASSSIEDIPTGRHDFIFSPNRLNVAVSRAKCIAVVVASKDLVSTNPKGIHDMGNLNHLCRVFQDTAGSEPLSRPIHWVSEG